MKRNTFLLGLSFLLTCVFGLLVFIFEPNRFPVLRLSWMNHSGQMIVHNRESVIVHFIQSKEDLELVRVIAYSERVIGGWKRDIILLSPFDFTRQDIGVDITAAFTIQAQYDHAESAILSSTAILRFYNVVQYRSIHTIVLEHVIPVFQMDDFKDENGNTIEMIMDSPCVNETKSVVHPESISSGIVRRVILGEFIGATDEMNGPNHSPFGLSDAYAIHGKSGFGKYARYEQIRKRFDWLNSTQHLALTFWGSFRTQTGYANCEGGIQTSKPGTVVSVPYKPSDPRSELYVHFLALKLHMEVRDRKLNTQH